MSIEQDLKKLAYQEEVLQFDHFDKTTAWDLGSRLKAAAEARGVHIVIDIQFNGQPLFFYAMPNASPSNADWVRRKRNSVLRFQKSSYFLGLDFKFKQINVYEVNGLSVSDYAIHGGCFPLRLRGSGLVGTIGISGLPQREDHNLLVEVLAQMLGKPLQDLALSAE